MATIEHIFTGDATDLIGALDDIDAKVKETDNSVKKTGDDSNDAFSKKGAGSAKAFSLAMSGAAVAAAAVAASIVTVVKATIELSGELTDLYNGAKRIGSTTDEFQKVQGALDHVATGAVDAADVFGELNKKIGEARKGGNETSDAFNALGINLNTLERLSPTEQLALLADALSEVEDASVRATLADKILAGQSDELTGVFAEGGDAIRQAAAETEAMGLISEEAILQAKELSDAQSELKDAFLILKTEVLGPLIPVLTETADKLKKIILEASKTGELEAFGEVLADIANSGVIEILVDLVDIITKLGPLAEVIGFLLERMWILPVKAIEALIALLSGDTEGALNAVKDVVESLSFGLIDFADETDDATESQYWLEKQAYETAKALALVTRSEGYFGDEIGRTQETRDKLVKTLREQAFAQRDLNKAQAEGTKTTVTWTEETSRATKGSEDLTAGLDSTAESTDKVDKGLSEAASEQKSSDINSLSENWAIFQDELGGVSDGMMAYGAVADEVLGLIGDAQQRQTEGWLEAVEDTTSKIESIDEQLAGTLSDTRREELEEQKANLQEQKQNQKDAALEAYNANKASAIASAAINTALAVVSALANTPGPFPVAVGFSIAAGIAGAASIAAIAAEPAPSFHSGGMLAPDEGVFIGRAGEAVLNPSAVSSIGGEQAVNELNRGSGGSNANIVTVLQVNNKTTDAMMTENLRTKRGPLSEQLRAAQPTRVKVVGHSVPKSFQ